MSKLKFLKWQNFSTESIFLLVVVFLYGCSPESSIQDTKPLETSLSSPTTNALVKNKSLVTEKTRQTYQWYCSQCHGVKGQGHGVNAPHLVVPPRDHTKSTYLETRSDQQLYNAIKLGGLAVGRAPCMPAWGYTIDDKMIWSLVVYIRDLCDCQAL